MSFPLSPTNGQQTVLNGITYAYVSASNLWTRLPGSFTATTVLAISGSTQSTSTATGALVVAGGVGVGGNIYFGGNLYQNGVLFTGGGVSSIGTSTTSTFTILNTTSSTSTTTGALVVSGGVGVGGIINATGFSGVGGLGNISGVNQYSGQNITATGTVTATNLSVIGNVISVFTVSNATAATSTQTGAMVIAGGLGVGGTVYAQNFVGGTGLGIIRCVAYIYATNVISTSITATTVYSNTVNIGGSGNSASTQSGALVVAGGVGIGGNIYFGGNLYQNGVLFTGGSGGSGAVDPIVVNDISTQFDGVKTVFALRQNQTSINTIVDSKDLEVVINGARLTPYVKQQTYPWLMDYDSFRGFRVSGSDLIIFNAPAIGDSAAVIVRSISASVQTRKYPYSATTIAFGD